jgi:glycosyltransferase involved in cell wall biosynthesis
MVSISIIHIAADLNLRFGGPSVSIIGLINALRKFNFNLFLLSQSHSKESGGTVTSKAIKRKILFSKSHLILFSGILLKYQAIKILSKNKAIIHSHGLWHPCNFWAGYLAKKYSCPHIIHPRGMLEPWAFQYKKWKKVLAMFLFQKKYLHLASVIVATSSQEYKNLRLMGFKNPIAIIPNGIDVKKTFTRKVLHNNTKRERVALFISRIHEKKGLLNLIYAWSKIDRKDWKLLIAGPDDNNFSKIFLELAVNLGVKDSITYLGEVYGEKKENLYKNSDLFILPTFSENFGIVIAEALSFGLPVITTKKAPWRDLQKYKCGWWIDIGVNPLFKSINNAISLTDKERFIMGLNGQEYIRKYNWENSAKITNDMYLWVLKLGKKPDCIILK